MAPKPETGTPPIVDSDNDNDSDYHLHVVRQLSRVVGPDGIHEVATDKTHHSVDARRRPVGNRSNRLAGHHAGGDSDSDGTGFYYLSREARSNIPRYEYRGEDRSLLYRYVLSPLADFCVHRLTPVSVAPNTITVTGLLFMLLAYLVYWYFVPNLQLDFDNEPPRWIFLYNCIAMLAYQTLDNMDGKQARRTGSGTPMGLLFDHGCDSINPIFGSANWIIGMGLQPLEDPWDATLAAVVVFAPFTSFFVTTWEEYYTGELIMPIVNGPSDGLFGGAMLSLTSFAIGPAFWQQNNWSETILDNSPKLVVAALGRYASSVTQLRNCDWLVAAAAVGLGQEYILKTFNVVRKYGTRAMVDQLPFLAFVGCSFIIGTNLPDIWQHQPRTVFLLLATIFMDMSTDLMLCHVAEQRYTPYRWQLLPMAVLTLWSFVSDQWTQQYVVAYASAMLVYDAMKVSLVLHELCQLLDISCFTIGSKQKAQ